MLLKFSTLSQVQEKDNKTNFTLGEKEAPEIAQCQFLFSKWAEQKREDTGKV